MREVAKTMPHLTNVFFRWFLTIAIAAGFDFIRFNEEIFSYFLWFAFRASLLYRFINPCIQIQTEKYM